MTKPNNTSNKLTNKEILLLMDLRFKGIDGIKAEMDDQHTKIQFLIYERASVQFREVIGDKLLTKAKKSSSDNLFNTPISHLEHYLFNLPEDFWEKYRKAKKLLKFFNGLEKHHLDIDLTGTKKALLQLEPAFLTLKTKKGTLLKNFL